MVPQPATGSAANPDVGRNQGEEIAFAGYQIQGLEIIGYDPATDRFPPPFTPPWPGPDPCEYDVRGNQMRIRTELAGGATCTGSFSADGTSGSGGWRPDPGKEGPGNVAYDITTT